MDMQAIDHFKQGRAELVRRLDKLDVERRTLVAQLAHADELIGFLAAAGDSVEVAGFSATMNAEATRSPTIGEGLLMLARERDEFVYKDAAAYLTSKGVKFTDNSLSSVISRTSGLERVKKGVYRLKRSEASALAEAPGDTSAAVDAAVPDTREGGDGHDVDHRDHRPAQVAG